MTEIFQSLLTCWNLLNALRLFRVLDEPGKTLKLLLSPVHVGRQSHPRLTKVKVGSKTIRALEIVHVKKLISNAVL